MNRAATLADRLRDALAIELPAATIMIPGDGEHPDFPTDAPEAAAAVLVAIVDRPEPTVILTRRSDALRNHAGQVAFPGGRVDPGDADATAAALREAYEEIGLDPSRVEIVGVANPYRTITGFAVTPVIGVVPPGLTLSPHEAEVAAVFEVPLAFLIDPVNQIERTAHWRGTDRNYIEILHGGFRIWGATAAMIANLSRRLSALR